MVAFRVPVLGVVMLASCTDPEVRKAREAEQARTRVAAESAVASTAPSRVAAGAWTDALLVKRLVDAGLAPQRRDSVRSLAWVGVPVHAFRLGVATLDAYIFADSAARQAVAARLDPATLAPRGEPSPWGQFRAVVENGNLLAFVVGGTDRQRERIVAALSAGIGSR